MTDTERLDWFEKNAGDIVVQRAKDGTSLTFAYCTGTDDNGWPTWSEFDTFRNTVDKAQCLSPKLVKQSRKRSF